jgi:hypothetical protein
MTAQEARAITGTKDIDSTIELIKLTAESGIGEIEFSELSEYCISKLQELGYSVIRYEFQGMGSCFYRVSW